MIFPCALAPYAISLFSSSQGLRRSRAQGIQHVMPHPPYPCKNGAPRAEPRRSAFGASLRLPTPAGVATGRVAAAAAISKQGGEYATGYLSEYHQSDRGRARKGRASVVQSRGTPSIAAGRIKGPLRASGIPYQASMC